MSIGNGDGTPEGRFLEGAFQLDANCGSVRMLMLVAVLLDRYTTGSVRVGQEHLDAVAKRRLEVTIDENTKDIWLKLER